MVRETVAMETLASAATVRMSGLLPAVLRDAFRGTRKSPIRLECKPHVTAGDWGLAELAGRAEFAVLAGFGCEMEGFSEDGSCDGAEAGLGGARFGMNPGLMFRTDHEKES